MKTIDERLDDIERRVRKLETVAAGLLLAVGPEAVAKATAQELHRAVEARVETSRARTERLVAEGKLTPIDDVETGALLSLSASDGSAMQLFEHTLTPDLKSAVAGKKKGDSIDAGAGLTIRIDAVYRPAPSEGEQPAAG